MKMKLDASLAFILPSSYFPLRVRYLPPHPPILSISLLIPPPFSPPPSPLTSHLPSPFFLQTPTELQNSDTPSWIRALFLGSCVRLAGRFLRFLFPRLFSRLLFPLLFRRLRLRLSLRLGPRLRLRAVKSARRNRRSLPSRTRTLCRVYMCPLQSRPHLEPRVRDRVGARLDRRRVRGKKGRRRGAQGSAGRRDRSLIPRRCASGGGGRSGRALVGVPDWIGAGGTDRGAERGSEKRRNGSRMDGEGRRCNLCAWRGWEDEMT